ncbi:sulfite exporter TauE/SafE family protein [Bradyrhizobium sp. 83002]|uniref:sulfite exporter TauE/SafE family protein n=1 Tax=Bradyrhizobium aeschynomenes TaxID=2734909 RepID=UPI001556B5FE|nr:sulfite exporter TauE/SafE family protein [Bradyrhizobium aeschynomenes]NPU14950.1 sulfite exporter TauE/SafE family protein [Bradyrhizobium aeschynomenes]
MTFSGAELALGSLSGSLVGFTLGLIGGGGSVLAVPLMVYLVGVANPHVAIGTSAVAVAINAAANLANHARSGNVKWPCALVFAATGVVGAFAGSTLGKTIDGQKLLLLFALVMIVIGLLMLRKRGGEGHLDVKLSRDNLWPLLAFGFGTGTLSGFFGIGGGFLIVPALMFATGMPILYAIGSSLVSVTAFGLTTATNYALSGLVDWALAAIFLVAGIAGGLAGARLAARLSGTRGTLNKVFATMVFAVAAYMIYRSLLAMSGAG